MTAAAEYPGGKLLCEMDDLPEAQIPAETLDPGFNRILEQRRTEPAPDKTTPAAPPAPVDTMGAIALEIVQLRKWQVFPLHTPNPTNGLCTCGDPKCTSQGKHPRTANGFQDSSSSPDIVRQWWTRWSNANIGVPTGFQNHIAVLDVDPRHDGDKSLAKLEAKYGKIPSTFTVQTGSGGSHFYFSRYAGPKLKSVSNALGDEYPGLDWKSEGGYVVGPGSLHVSGGRYEIVNDVALVDVPEWLETLLISAPGTNGAQRASIPFTAPDILKEGARDETLLAMATSLANKNLGYDPVLAALREFNRTRCSPPYDDAKIVAIVKRQCDFVRQNPSSRPERPAPRIKEPAKTIQTPAADDPETAKNDSETLKKALQIYENGKFIDHCEEVFSRVWLGDCHILDGVIYCAANMRVINAKDAIHIHVSGSTQSGKSDSIKTALQFIHPADQATKTFSPMYLFHASKSGDLHAKMVIFTDDTVLSEDIAALYRNVLTSWFTGVDRGTVTNNEPKTLHIPARISLILTSIDSVVSQSDEGQDESRFLTLEVHRTSDQMAAIRQFIQSNKPDLKKELSTISAVWNLITPREITLHKTIEKDLPIREFKRFLTLCQARALLCNRSSTNDQDFDAIEKFLSYSRPMINSTTAAFTRREAVVRGVLTDKLKSVSDIVDETGMSIADVYRALHGNRGTFQNPTGGLMQKESRLQHSEERPEHKNTIHQFRLKGEK